MHGQSGWNNVSGAGGGQAIYDSLGALVGSVSVSSDTGGGVLSGSRYDGTGGSAFPDPGTDPLQILYNGVNFNMNHGYVSVSLSGGVPSGGYDLYFFGDAGQMPVYTGSYGGTLVGTSSDMGSSFANPGIGMLHLAANGGAPITFYFNDHGNWNYDPPWIEGKHLLSGFQFVEAGGEVPEPGTLLILGGSLLGLCVGGLRRFRKK